HDGARARRSRRAHGARGARARDRHRRSARVGVTSRILLRSPLNPRGDGSKGGRSPAFPQNFPPTGGSALMPETTKQPDREIGAEEDFGALFERSLKQPKQGEVVTGRVVHIGRDAVTIDIGYKSEGSIPLDEFTT